MIHHSKLHDEFFSTTGEAGIVEIISKMGQAIAKELKSRGVSGLILVST
ncbi:MAG: hypothetical protein JRJ85_10950 [Deltaproteobacteria bacterium]|nr:hypothetical protein [Deltaproteobacteria bacterium]